jgi:hypothetical protein
MPTLWQVLFAIAAGSVAGALLRRMATMLLPNATGTSGCSCVLVAWAMIAVMLLAMSQLAAVGGGTRASFI